MSGSAGGLGVDLRGCVWLTVEERDGTSVTCRSLRLCVVDSGGTRWHGCHVNSEGACEKRDVGSRDVAQRINGCVNVVAGISSCVTSGGPSGIDMTTEMDSVNMPEQLLQHLASKSRLPSDRLMMAEPMPASAMTAAAAAIQPAIDCAPRSLGSQPTRFVGFGDRARCAGGEREVVADLKGEFIAEFSSIDAKRRLKQELELCTQHPEENLKEFIYTIVAYYERIGGKVSESEKLAKSTDGLRSVIGGGFSTSHRHLQLIKLRETLPSDLLLMWLACQEHSPGVMAAAAVLFQHPLAAFYWPLHLAVIQPPGPAAQIARFYYQATFPYAATAARIPTARRRWNYVPSLQRIWPHGPSAPLLPMQRNWTYPLRVPRKREVVGATPANTYETVPRDTGKSTSAGNRLVAVKHSLKVQDTMGHKQPHPTLPVCARFVSGHCAWQDCDRHGLFEEVLLVPGIGSTIPAEGIPAMNKVLDDLYNDSALALHVSE
ncbi:hypothetical protein HPB52_021218 [Rhipicephalus sanguineus]|uniref:Uncharacterized protein n=1 Tax=Rhipicephalus sanguineus TaxID=34632 RepID=A0A9D4T1T7_RHISA|nr:hypothetical protein HPB52_021218 [Rhipicephalus sanguineus]